MSGHKPDNKENTSNAKGTRPFFYLTPAKAIGGFLATLLTGALLGGLAWVLVVIGADFVITEWTAGHYGWTTSDKHVYQITAPASVLNNIWPQSVTIANQAAIVVGIAITIGCLIYMVAQFAEGKDPLEDPDESV